MFVSQGLVDPKVSHKLSWSKGKQVNIPVHSKFAVTLRANLSLGRGVIARTRCRHYELVVFVLV